MMSFMSAALGSGLGSGEGGNDAGDALALMLLGTLADVLEVLPMCALEKALTVRD